MILIYENINISGTNFAMFLITGRFLQVQLGVCLLKMFAYSDFSSIECVFPPLLVSL